MRGKIRIGLKFLMWEGFCQSLELKRTNTEPTRTFYRKGSDYGDPPGQMFISHFSHPDLSYVCPCEIIHDTLNELSIFPGKRAPFVMDQCCQRSQHLS